MSRPPLTPDADVMRAQQRWRLQPVPARLLVRWERWRGDRHLPARADIDPAALEPALLPHLYLTDVIDGGRRFRFRLVGTAGVRARGDDLTGKYIDEIPNRNPAYQPYILDLYRQTVAAGRPVIAETRFLSASGDEERWSQRVLCPLAADGRTVDMVVAAQINRAPGRGDTDAMLINVDRFESSRLEVVPDGWR